MASSIESHSIRTCRSPAHQIGVWAVVWPANVAGYNNFMTCTASRGCGTINSGPLHEFLGSVAVGSDGGYWYSYYAGAASGNGTLRQQVVYYPNPASGMVPVGADTTMSIDSTSWLSWAPGTAPCPGNVPCRVAGEYSRLASFGPNLESSAPYLPSGAALRTTFTQDPQSGNISNFSPKFVPAVLAATLRLAGAERLRGNQRWGKSRFTYLRFAPMRLSRRFALRRLFDNLRCWRIGARVAPRPRAPAFIPLVCASCSKLFR